MLLGDWKRMLWITSSYHQCPSVQLLSYTERFVVVCTNGHSIEIFNTWNPDERLISYLLINTVYKIHIYSFPMIDTESSTKNFTAPNPHNSESHTPLSASRRRLWARVSTTPLKPWNLHHVRWQGTSFGLRAIWSHPIPCKGQLARGPKSQEGLSRTLHPQRDLQALSTYQ